MANYPVGSVWKRWDLHVHTPDTALANEFRDWEEYLAAIEAQTDVVVIGVTDYYSISNYERMYRAREDGRIRNIDLLIPNIEFRITPQTAQNKGINLHLLVSPEDSEHIARINEALGRLTFKFREETYSCLPGQLRRLGKQFDPAIKEDHVALSAGINQFKIDFSTIRDWLNAEPWLKRNSLVAVAAGSNDGASGLREDGFQALRFEIMSFADIIFSANPKDREFWLGKSSKGIEEVRSMGGPKPCVHGSDAHRLDKLFKPDYNRFCWIKADTTFEGLRQILLEPEERVWIGETPPCLHDNSRVLSSVTIRNSDGWFDEAPVEFNPGLVGVIGAKGSGKSALADLIAFAGGSWDHTDKSSFLHRARSALAGTEITLAWSDGTVSPAVQVTVKGPGPAKEGEGSVKYLSQRFVERLCSEDVGGKELLSEIESVIFAHLDPTATLNVSSFPDLRAKKTEAVELEKQRIFEELQRLNREIETLRDRNATLPERRAKLETLVKEREGLAKQLPAAATPEEAKAAEALTALQDELNRVLRNVGRNREALVRLDTIADRVTAFEKDMVRFHEVISADLREIGVDETGLAAFRPAFRGDVQAPLKAAKERITAQIAALEGRPDDGQKGTVLALQAAVEELKEKTSADEAKRKRHSDLQKRIGQADMEIERIRREIGEIVEVESQRLTAARAARSAAYRDHFACLRREQAVLEELYGPLQSRLGQSDEKQERRLEFHVRWAVDVDAWVERGFALLDQRKALPYATREAMRDAANEHLLAAWSGGDAGTLVPGMAAFIKPFQNPEVPLRSLLRTNVKPTEFAEWLFSVGHIELRYGIRYNGTDLEKLSPGTKGIVLLMLYLGMEGDDSRPLLVDQPEENLDNESVFNLLAGYFRSAKTRRQIIVITHNPNLVVNTDAEQVIVANCERKENGHPEIRYLSGALENAAEPDGIRQHVCRVLEGGERAFHQREKRYAFKG